MAAEPHQELIIIKRHGGHSDGHHGGAWKIAFADFMTAMMALFLVLWLISATNPKQRIVIAHYFNPVKLAEVSINKKGLDDPSPGEGGHGGPKVGEIYEKQLDRPPQQEKKALYDHGEVKSTHDEATLFKDPYAILAQIAAETQPVETNSKSQMLEQVADAPPAESSDMFRDPFSTIPSIEPPQAAADSDAAKNAQVSAAKAADNDKSGGQTEDSKPLGAAQTIAPSTANAPPAVNPPPAGNPPSAANPASSGPEKEKALLPSKDPAKNIIQTAPAAEQQAADNMQANEKAAAELRDKITNAMHQDAGLAGSPNIEVKATAEGVLISLTDENTYSMFAVGSAEPLSKTVEVVGKVAQLLKTLPGKIVVRGHTDGRPYKSANYDNWQLSAARAQMAHYMLVRGGLDENRIDRIEGYADHQLKVPNEPLADENRRIEFLLRKDKP